ncbi:MAG: hypothetical protein ABJF50_25370 [Paracoccaceae bacterium]|uniref:hypothetical protein n=1 Tax=Hyphomonas sp. TaxID=87 RepID=UPI00326FDD9F
MKRLGSAHLRSISFFDFLDGELASSEYYLLFRFALERVEIDVLTGDISYSRATAEDIEDFANRLTYNNPNTVSEPGSTVSALWSFNFGAGPTAADGKAITQLTAEDLFERSGGKVRFIGETSAGILFDFLLSNASTTVRPLLTTLTPGDNIDRVERFWDPLSAFFVEHTNGPLLTLTPLTGLDSVFGRIEVPAVDDNGSITTINGEELDALNNAGILNVDLFSDVEQARRAYVMAQLNGSFSGNLISSTGSLRD